MEKIVVNVNGGLGKNIAATAVLKQIKKVHPSSVVHLCASYPDVFRGLSFVDRSYPQGPLPYFSQDHSDFDFLSQEPYHRVAFREGREHIVEAWCRSFGVEPPKDFAGVIKLNEQEHQAAMQLVRTVDRSKPWVAFQPFGGVSFHNPAAAGDPLAPKQVRDIPVPVAQEIVRKLTEKGCVVFQFSLPTEAKLEGVINFDLGKNEKGEPNIMHPRVMFAILNLCQYFIGIDSSCQHAWAALGKPAGKSVVLWGATKSENFSYPCHKNLSLAKCPTPACGRPNNAFPDIVDGGNVWSCPNERACMGFDPGEVVAVLNIPAQSSTPAPGAAPVIPPEPGPKA